MFYGASLVAQLVKNPPAMQETWVRSLDWEDPLEKGMTTHSSITLLYFYVTLCVILLTNSLAWTAIFKVQYIACDEAQIFIFDHY